MDLSVSKFRAGRAMVALLSLTMGAGALHATTYLLNPTASVSVSCNTATGPGAAASITVKPVTNLSGSNTLTVAFVAPSAGLTVTAPVNQVLSTTNQAAGIVYTVNTGANCIGASSGNTTLQFKAGLNAASPATDAVTTITDAVNTSASGLSVAPATASLTCTYVSGSPGTYTPGPVQTLSVSTSALAGIAYSLDTTAINDPAWLSVTPAAPSGTAGSAAQIFTVVAASGCGGFALNSTHTVNLHLVNAPAPDKLISVSLQIVSSTPLTVTPVPAAPKISLSYVKGSGVVASANVSVTSTVASAYVAINTATLPSWLTVDNTSGTAPWALRFSTTSVADSLAPGTYSATVYFQVSGYAALGVPVTLLVNNKAPTLSVNATQVSINWTLGTTIPTATIVATSSDSPIQYTITTGGALQPSVTAPQQSGLAYDFGTDILVSFNPLAFASAQPGSVLTGTVTLTWGSGSTTVVTYLVTVVSPGATLSGISPASLPTAVSGTRFTLNMAGTGFVGGSNAALATRVGIVVNNAIVTDTNLSISVINPSNITLTIAVPSVADQYLLFSPTGTGGTVNIGVVNGNSSGIPTGTATITIGAGPIIQGATSASAFTEVTPPTLPTFAPYDIVSLFGANFCSSQGTGCGTSTGLQGSPDALTLRFPMTLSPDASGATQRSVSVSFVQHGTATLIGAAPLLFASNSQINLVVPAAVAGFVGAETVDVIVYFGYGSGATLLQSAAFPVNIAAADPGIFTIGADGQGSGAILDSAWSLISSSNPAGVRTGSGGSPDSDVVQIFLTGLGAPTSTADNTITGGSTPPGDCILSTGAGSYEASLQAATNVSPALGSIDGAVVQSALLNSGRYPPCFTSNPTVTIGGVAAAVSYAGFVADSIAGLYQINAQLPASTSTFYPNFPSTTTSIAGVTAPVQLPVQVTFSSATSQSGVTVWVAPRLNVTGPTGSALNAEVGVQWSGTVAAIEGTGNIQYSLASGLLPTGLTLVGSTGVISGRPGAGTAGSYTVTVKATDSATTPVTGTVTFTIVVAGGLYMTSTGAAPFNSTFGAAIPSFTVTATGGTYPYTYVLSYAGTGTPANVSVGLHTGVMTLPATLPAGTYHVTLTATDSAGISLTGTYNFDMIVALNVTEAAGTGPTLAVITVTGNTGTLQYTLDSASNTAGLAIDGSGNLTAGGASSGTYPVTVTVADTVTLAPGASVEGAGTVGPFSVMF